MDKTPPPAALAALAVYYDGTCPLCQREIGHYRSLQPACAVQWVDVSASSTALPPGISRADALARFHVRRPDGTVLSGARAFIELWTHMPGWRWLALPLRVAPLPWLAEHAYRAFLRVRPWLQRRAATRPRSVVTLRR